MILVDVVHFSRNGKDSGKMAATNHKKYNEQFFVEQKE